MRQAHHFDMRADKASMILLVVVSLLILGILGWGIEYKLSLYDAAQIQHPTVPAAKLLSQKERPQTHGAIARIFERATPWFFAANAFLLSLLRATAHPLQARLHPKPASPHLRIGKQLHGHMRYSSFRPPPFFLA